MKGASCQICDNIRGVTPFFSTLSLYREMVCQYRKGQFIECMEDTLWGQYIPGKEGCGQGGEREPLPLRLKRGF